LKKQRQRKKERKEKRKTKKELKRRMKYLKKTVMQCNPEQLSEILYELENSPELNKKEIKVLIAKRADAPSEIIEKLKNDKEAEIRFWAYDTEQQKNRDFQVKRSLL